MIDQDWIANWEPVMWVSGKHAGNYYERMGSEVSLLQEGLIAGPRRDEVWPMEVFRLLHPLVLPCDDYTTPNVLVKNNTVLHRPRFETVDCSHLTFH